MWRGEGEGKRKGDGEREKGEREGGYGGGIRKGLGDLSGRWV